MGKYVYQHDWWSTSDDAAEECRIRITLDEDRLARIAGAAMRNANGKAQSGPMSAVVTERRQKQPDQE
jgi:hypothetical protein